MVDDFFKIISNPIRQKILGELQIGKKTAKELELTLKDDIFVLYHHLNFLEKHGIITSESLNNEKIFSININFTESIIEHLSGLHDEYEVIKICIPEDSQIISTVKNKLRELDTLVNSVRGGGKNYLIFLIRKQMLEDGGNVMRKNLEDIVKEYVEKHDVKALDIISILAYQQSSKSLYRKNQSKFEKQIKDCAEWNMRLKYTLNEEDCKSKSVILDIFKEYKYEEFEILRSILAQHASELMRQDFNDRYYKLNDVDKIALKYILDYFPKKINESRKNGVKIGSSGFGIIDGFYIRTEPSDAVDEKDIIYFEATGLLIDLEKKNEIYTISSRRADNISENNLYISRDTLRYCPTLGNLLLKTGIGYWVPRITVKNENISYELVVPKYLYDIGTEVIKSPPKQP